MNIPLLVLLFAWLVLALYRVREFRRVLLSGLLLILSFPPFPFPFLSFFAFVPLWTIRSRFSTGMAFLLFNIGATSWLLQASIAGGLAAILINTGLMTLTFGFARFLEKAFPKGGIFWLAIPWLSFEFLHFHWELAWPWLTLGNSFSSLPAFVQWYEFVGRLGGSLWILLLNGLIYQTYLKKTRRYLLLTAGALLLPVAFSLILFYTSLSAGESWNVLLVQPNLNPYTQKHSGTFEEELDHYFSLTEGQLNDSLDWLVFPEASFSQLPLDHPGDNRKFLALRRRLEGFPNLRLLTGLTGYTLHNDPDVTRPEWIPQIDSSYLELLNVAVVVRADSVDNQLHVKSKLVPGSEFVPFLQWLSPLRPVFQKFGASGYGFGRRPMPVVIEGAGPVICYESVFSEYCSALIKEGAGAFFILTDDGWWDRWRAPRQHLAYASLLAIEHRRYIVRAANTGISALIDQRGIVLSKLEYQRSGTLQGKVVISDRITRYSVTGDLVGRIAAGLLLLASILAVLKSLFPKLSKNP